MRSVHVSKLWLYSICPGAYMSEPYAPRRETREAAMGTDMHAMAEREEWEGDAEQTEILGRWKTYLEKQREKWVNAREAKEVRLETALMDGVSLVGRMDHVLLLPGRVYVLDLKTGHEEVYSEKIKSQMGGYAYLSLVDDPSVEIVYVSAYNARLDQEYTTSYTRDVLPQLRQMILDIVEPCVGPKMTLSPGDHCTWCNSFSGCPAVRNTALVTIDKVRGGKLVLDWRSVDSPQLGKIYERLALAEDLRVQCRKELEERLNTGDQDTGYRLMTCRGHRQIEDLLEAWDRLRTVGVQPAHFLYACNLSLPKLETIATDPQGSGLKLETVETALKGLVTRRPSYTRLVKEK